MTMKFLNKPITIKEVVLLLIVLSLIAFNWLWLIVSDLYNSVALLIIGFYFWDSVPKSVEDKLQQQDVVVKSDQTSIESNVWDVWLFPQEDYVEAPANPFKDE